MNGTEFVSTEFHIGTFIPFSQKFARVKKRGEAFRLDLKLRSGERRMAFTLPSISSWAVFIAGASFGAWLRGLWTNGSTEQQAALEREAAQSLHESELKIARLEALLEDVRTQLSSSLERRVLLEDQLRVCQKQQTEAETRLAATEQNLSQQMERFERTLEQSRQLFTDTFGKLAAEALATNNDVFLALAEQKFVGLRSEADRILDEKRVAIHGLLAPLNETLASYQKQTREMQEGHIRDLSAVGEQLRSLVSAQSALQNETARLVNALKSPQVRGRWGQVQLRRLVELAGMSAHCDFTEEVSIISAHGRQRPDMVVHLPARREVVVDAKVPMGAYLDAIEALSETDKGLALRRHAAQVREHLKSLSLKQYWEQFSFTPEFVVMFIPNDSFLSAAAEADPELIEAALERNVILATPSTLIALLKAIAFGWRQEKASESAQRIRELGEELAERIATLVEHFRRLGSSLSKSVEAYNGAIGAFESRVVVSARRFRQLGAGRSAEIAESSRVNVIPRMPG